MMANDKYCKFYQHQNTNDDKLIIIVGLWQFSFETHKQDRSKSEKTRRYRRFRAVFNGT